MGYYTSYSLTMYGEKEKIEAAQQTLLEETKDSQGYDGDIKELIETGGVWAKCYDLEDQLTSVAEKHPDVLIILEGDGENSDDLWEARWKGTEYEKQEAKIPPFTNKNLLTESEKENNN